MTPPRGTRTLEGDPAASASLGEAHAFLLAGAVARAADLTAALDADEWPRREFDTLVNFLRASLLRQASDEEVGLFPADPYRTPFAGVAADHARLRDLIGELGEVGREGGEPARVRELVAALLATLRRHVQGEEELIRAGAGPTPHGEAGAGPGEEEAPVVLRLEGPPRPAAVQACIERVLRLRRGQTAEIHATDPHSLDAVRRWMRAFDSTGYGAMVTTAGDGRTVLQITRRPGD